MFFLYSFFFFNATATTEIYTLSLHDALPICPGRRRGGQSACRAVGRSGPRILGRKTDGEHRNSTNTGARSEEHTSELQSRRDLVCRLLLEKKKNPHDVSRREDLRVMESDSAL